MAGEIDGCAERSHYHFRISLRIWHPSADPQNITKVLRIQPSHCWKTGECRRTPKGTPLAGVNRNTFWTAAVLAGRWPEKIGLEIYEVLLRLAPHRSYFHTVRLEGGKIELFVGWFFENQSGDLINYECLALAGDLQIDLSFDIYPPDEPQNENDISIADQPEIERPLQSS